MADSASFLRAAENILRGDDSVDAAHRLEAVLLAEYDRDEVMVDLLEALAMYSPGSGTPYVDYPELVARIRATLSSLGIPVTP